MDINVGFSTYTMKNLITSIKCDNFFFIITENV